MSDLAQRSRKISAFEYWLRTGRRALVEYKFNGWHDPDDGKFTEVSAGRYFPRGAPSAGKSSDIKRDHNSSAKAGNSESRNGAAAVRATPKVPASQPQITESRPAESMGGSRSSDSVRVEAPYLTAVHNDILNHASIHPPEPGTNEWTMDDFSRWKLGAENIFDFKKQWVHGYRSAINDAASLFDLPPELLAGTAFNEIGGDPQEVDTLAYSLRNDLGRDKTSFGNVSIQVRRAAEALGYDTRHELTETQRRAVIAALEDPKANIYVAAKHLSDLRNIDFKGKKGSVLTKSDVEIIATRYNRGPDMPIGQIRKDLSYGRAITKRWTLLKSLLR